MYDSPVFLPSGDRALVVEFGDSIDPETNRCVHDLLFAIENAGVHGVLDMIPSYRSLLVCYDPTVVSYVELQSVLEELEGAIIGDTGLMNPDVVKIPTLYGGEHGPDLGFVADHSRLSVEDVIALHSGRDYLVYMIGFSPGFPYLGGLSERLYTPRLETPRGRIHAGSVGIADKQTGVYSLPSPGGWRLIGRTPLQLFNPNREPPSILKAGNYVRFVPISTEEEFIDIQGRVETGEYKIVVEAAS